MNLRMKKFMFRDLGEQSTNTPPPRNSLFAKASLVMRRMFYKQ